MSRRDSVASSRSGRLVLLGLIFLLLVAVSSACTANQEKIASAVQQTLTAQAEMTSAFDSAVATAAAAIAGQVGAGALQATATPIPPPPVVVNSQEPCGADCEDRIAQEVNNRANEIATKAVEAYIADEQAALDDDLDASGGGGSVPCGGLPCATVIAGSNVNVRSGPGTQYEMIDFLPNGASVPVVARSQSGWLNVLMSENLDRKGWVKAEFMDVSEPLLQVAIVETIPPTPKIWPTATPTPTSTPTPMPTATPTSTPEPSITVSVLNVSSSTICRLEVYPTIDLSGDNRLKNPLGPGDDIEIKLTGEAKVFDFRALGCDSQLIGELHSQVIEEDFTWVITNEQLSE